MSMHSCHLLQSKQECYGLGAKICNSLKKPKAEHAKHLSELFPSTSAAVKRPNPAAFDPQADVWSCLNRKRKRAQKFVQRL